MRTCRNEATFSGSSQAGHEQAGRRPVLVLSPAAYNGRTGLMLCCPITSQVKGYPFEVKVDETPDLRGVVLADQVKSLDWRARRARKMSSVTATVVDEVAARIQALLP